MYGQVFVCGGHDPRVEEITSPAIEVPASRRCWAFRDGVGWRQLSIRYHDSAYLRNPNDEIWIMLGHIANQRFESDSISARQSIRGRSFLV